MQKIVLSTLLFFGISVSALWSLPAKEELSFAVMKKADTEYLFGEKGEVSVSLLSDKEMKETEGEWGWGGAAFGAALYVASSSVQGKPITTHGLVVAAVAGVAGDMVGTSLGGSFISAGAGGTWSGTIASATTSLAYNEFGGNKLSFSFKKRRSYFTTRR